MKHRMFTFILALPALFLLSGCLLTNPVITLTCDGFTFGIDEAQVIVDNTGEGLQFTEILITDGYGNHLLDMGFPLPIGEVIPGGTTPLIPYEFAPVANPLRLIISSPAGFDLLEYTIWYAVSGECPGLPYANEDAPQNTDPQPAFRDGRINNFDGAAPVAVYPHQVNGETGLIVYGAGGLVLLVSPEQLAAAPEFPESNLLIAEGNGVTLYRLTSGEWQINARQYNGKLYVLIFTELYANAGYTSYELE